MKTRTILGGVVVVVIVLAWWQWPGDAPRVTAPAARAGAAAGVAHVPRPTATAPRPDDDTAPSPPVIDEVVVEKAELCAGEENLITVRAHAADPEDDDHLHGVVDGLPGMSVPVIARAPGPDTAPAEVLVFGRGNTRVSAPIPPYVVRDCAAAHRLAVAYRLRLNTNAEFELDAQITDQDPADPFRAVAYVWSFGDGTTATTTEPHAVHDYGHRPQRGVYSNMLVTVTARTASDAVLVGRKAVLFHNAEYANLEFAGVVTLVVELTPRFPTITAGKVVQGLRLWHHRPAPVHIDRVRARRNSSRPGTEPVVTEVPVASVLGTDTIPAAGISFDLTLDVATDPDVFSIDYLLEGTSAEGYPVESTFSVMTPPRPTAEHHVPVDDPALVEKILRARELLGQDLVSDEDLASLQRKGAFDDFKPRADDPDRKLPPAYGP